MTWITDLETNAADLLSFLFVTPTLLGEQRLAHVIKDISARTRKIVEAVLTFNPKVIVRLALAFSLTFSATFVEALVFQTYHLINVLDVVLPVFIYTAVMSVFLCVALFVFSSVVENYIGEYEDLARRFLIVGALIFTFSRLLAITNALNEPWHLHVSPFFAKLSHTSSSSSLPPSGVTVRLHPP